jgi:hypothetical protein
MSLFLFYIMKVTLRNVSPARWKHVAACLILILSSLNVFAQVEGDERDLKIKIEDAIRLYPRKKITAYDQLSQLGNSSFPFLVEIIRNDDYSPYGRIFKKSSLNPFLLTVIENSSDHKAEVALIRLLNGSDNLVKGMAMQGLGKKKSQLALPCLIQSLEDGSVFLYNRITDQGPDAEPIDEVVTIRDVAIETLEGITGVVLKPSKDNAIKAKAWTRWAKRQKLTQQCSLAETANDYDSLGKIFRNRK